MGSMEQHPSMELETNPRSLHLNPAWLYNVHPHSSFQNRLDCKSDSIQTKCKRSNIETESIDPQLKAQSRDDRLDIAA